MAKPIKKSVLCVHLINEVAEGKYRVIALIGRKVLMNKFIGSNSTRRNWNLLVEQLEQDPRYKQLWIYEGEFYTSTELRD